MQKYVTYILPKKLLHKYFRKIREMEVNATLKYILYILK